MDQPTTASSHSTILRRVIAIILSLMDTGTGQVAMGLPRSGAIWFSISLILYAGFVASAVAGSPWAALVSIILIVGVRLAATVSTARLSVPANAPRKLILAAVIIGMYLMSVIAGLIGTQFARAYKLPTPAMYPTLEVGDRLFSSMVMKKLERGQIIVYLYPLDQSKSYIHRIIGMPGDIVEMRQGDLIVNGRQVERQRLSDPCIASPECTYWQESVDGNSYTIALMNDAPPSGPGRNFGPSMVPSGQLFVLGDNRDNSADSRYWGFVPTELVRANPRFLYWSAGEDGIRWDRIAKAVE